MQDIDKKTAEYFGFYENLEKLEHDLLLIQGVGNINYDLDGFYNNENEIIFNINYSLAAVEPDDYEECRRLKTEILGVLKAHGVTQDYNEIEDWGDRFYFSANCDDRWETKDNKIKRMEAEVHKRMAEIEM